MREWQQSENVIEIIDGRPFRVVTIVQLQLLQSNSRELGRVLGRRDQPSGKKTRPLFVRIPESGRVSGRELELYFNSFSFLERPELN